MSETEKPTRLEGPVEVVHEGGPLDGRVIGYPFDRYVPYLRVGFAGADQEAGEHARYRRDRIESGKLIYVFEGIGRREESGER